MTNLSPGICFQSRYPRILYCNVNVDVSTGNDRISFNLDILESSIVTSEKSSDLDGSSHPFNLDILESSIVTTLPITDKAFTVPFQSRYPRILYCNYSTISPGRIHSLFQSRYPRILYCNMMTSASLDRRG